MQSSIYLSVEVLGLLGGIVLRVRGDIATTDFLDGDVLHVEADVVTGKSLGQRLVVHLHRFHLNTGSEKERFSYDQRLVSSHGTRDFRVVSMVYVLSHSSQKKLGEHNGIY